MRFLEVVPVLRNRVALTPAYDAGLRLAEVGGAEGRGDRQQPHADPCRGRQEPLCDAVPATAVDSTLLLAPRPAGPLAVPGRGSCPSGE